MAGTIASLSLSQQFDAITGAFLSGGKLYLYEAATSTPVNVYEDFALTLLLPHPIEIGSNGRIPEFWVADGQYRALLRNAAGIKQFDIESTQALGPSTGGVEGGDSVSATAVFQIGDPLWLPRAGTRTGWVRANGRTIGSASSGATERANADCQDLFLELWNDYTDAICAVTTGRGANAAADWSANKKIATWTMQGRAAFGLDDMGNTAAGVIAGGTTAGASGGAETVTISQANLPNVTFSDTLTLPDHLHSDTLALASGTVTVTSLTVTGAPDLAATGVPDPNLILRAGAEVSITEGSTGTTHTLVRRAVDEVTVTANAGTLDVGGSAALASTALTGSVGNPTSNPAITGSVTSGGSGTAVAKLDPYRLGTWYIKL